MDSIAVETLKFGLEFLAAEELVLLALSLGFYPEFEVAEYVGGLFHVLLVSRCGGIKRRCGGIKRCFHLFPCGEVCQDYNPMRGKGFAHAFRGPSHAVKLK